MWSNLILLHSDKENRPTLDGEGLVSWHTCQRNVYFADGRIFSPSLEKTKESGYEIYYGFQAYQLLLEIVAGIKSKLFGESEIQAQFRDRFRKENLPPTSFSDSLLSLRDQILEHTKQIRSKFLVGLGRQTYGSIADLELRGHKEILLVGTGKLAEAVIPYLATKDRSLTLIGRNLNRLEFFKDKYGVSTYHFEDFTPTDQSVVVASSFLPFPWEIKLKNAPKVIDFREGNHHNQLGIQSISLSDILNRLQETDDHIVNLKLKLKEVVQSMATEREEEQIHLLHGWEDLTCLK